MSEETMTEEEKEEAAKGQENELIRSLRSQVESANRGEKDAKAAAIAAVAAVRAEVARTSQATAFVNELGFPQMAEVVASNVEGELTAESVGSYLVTLGLKKQAAPDTSGESTVETAVPDASGFQAITDLGSEVASAASGDPAQALDKRIGEADSFEEVQALAAEGGFLQG